MPPACPIFSAATGLVDGHSDQEPWDADVRREAGDPHPNPAGELFRFKAKQTGRVGSYRARVVFPATGLYKLAVYDGFPHAPCARVHTFKSVLIGDV